MKAQFIKYLIEKGYSQWTAKGTPSTVYDYAKRVQTVCEWEGITWAELSKSIGVIVKEYDCYGVKSAKGATSHNAVINALKRFQEFVLLLSGI